MVRYKAVLWSVLKFAYILLCHHFDVTRNLKAPKRASIE